MSVLTESRIERNNIVLKVEKFLLKNACLREKAGSLRVNFKKKKILKTFVGEVRYFQF